MLGISKDDEGLGGPDAHDAKTGKDDEGGLVACKFFFFFSFSLTLVCWLILLLDISRDDKGGPHTHAFLFIII